MSDETEQNNTQPDNSAPEDIIDIQTNANDAPSEEEVAAAYTPFSEEIDPSVYEPQQQTQTSAETKTPNESDIQVQLLQEQLERTKEQMVRALADAENSRKRAQKDREDASKFAISGFAKDVISVADNLRRAIEAVPEEADETLQALINGIEATERELLKSFEKNGIQKLLPIDQPFDPNQHEVMFEAPMPDKAHGTVIQVIEPGYVLNGRILRPARVGITKGNEDSTQNSSTEPGRTLNTEA